MPRRFLHKFKALKSKVFRRDRAVSSPVQTLVDQPERSRSPTPQAAAPDQLKAQVAVGCKELSLPSAMTSPPGAGHDEDADITKGLVAAAAAVGSAQTSYDQSQGSKTNKLANASGAVVEAVTSESNAMKAVWEGMSTLADSLPALASVLAGIAAAHPFIGPAVTAFKIVVELNSKRQSNDKKIGVLFLQMKDMMEALLQLRHIKDVESVDKETGITIRARMQTLCQLTADDIYKCGNTCDTYSKKRLLVKVIQSSSWEDALKDYIDLFAKRRDDFTFALSIHVGTGVDDANRKLDSLDIKVNILIKVLTSAATPEYAEVAALVQKKGGPGAVADNRKALGELLAFESTRASTELTGPERRDDSGYENPDADVDVLKSELLQKPGDAIQYNLAIFWNKYMLQQKDLADKIQRDVHQESDRVIEAVTSGSWDRIRNQEIKEIWKEMRWSGHVKAQQFVLVMRDYFRQRDNYRQRMNEKTYAGGEDNTSRIHDNDQWAIEWIDISRLPSISEAFDDDASGYITVAEVNELMDACPEGWSLPRWLAYWAIGWQTTATYYRDKIAELLAKMFALEPLVHSANTECTERYLQVVYRPVHTLASSIGDVNGSEALQTRFKDYVESEEQTLRRRLETIRYKIDAMDTLPLIAGAGRIEKYLFPLLYLLLKRDFEIFRLARQRQIDPNELGDSADSIRRVVQAVNLRHNKLEAIFKQRKLDPTQQFKVHANGLFDHWHESPKFWALQRQREEVLSPCRYVDEDEDQNVDSAAVLNYLCPAACKPVKDVRRPIPAHYAGCDVCRTRIHGARLICLQCGSRSTLDFCQKRACLDATVTREDLNEPHLPTHDFVKVRRTFNQDREIGTILRMSDAGLARARTLLEEAARKREASSGPQLRMMRLDEDAPWQLPTNDLLQEGEGEEGNEAATATPEPASASSASVDPKPKPEDKADPKCVACSDPVSYQCWYCIDCPAESDVFVCQQCDDEGGVAAGAHDATHSLVQCNEKVEAQSIEQRLSTLTEERLPAIELELTNLAWRVEMMPQMFIEALRNAASAHQASE